LKKERYEAFEEVDLDMEIETTGELDVDVDGKYIFKKMNASPIMNQFEPVTESTHHIRLKQLQ
jgi:hypothetical protein